jgi:hypothetical protein
MTIPPNRMYRQVQEDEGKATAKVHAEARRGARATATAGFTQRR